jgi:hypothetical protein
MSWETRDVIKQELRAQGRHQGTVAVAQWFCWDHLPEGDARQVSREVASLARSMTGFLPDSPELTVALRKLLEAKDCIVRATLEALD